jgi:ferredoxin
MATLNNISKEHPMSHRSKMDDWLKKRLDQYDEWLADRKIPFSSKVVPVTESLADKQWVLPTEQVIDFIVNARSFAIAPCACRTHYKRCDNPVDICIFLNDVSDKLVKKGFARRVSVDEMVEKLHRANVHGLIHLTLYSPEQYPFAICSCCPCCCHDLQLLLKYDRRDLVARSEYITVRDNELCTHCGMCVDRCVFGARTIKDGLMEYDPDMCYGCGLCVTACPNDSIRLERESNFIWSEGKASTPG